jgi:hypothetical protein
MIPRFLVLLLLAVARPAAIFANDAIAPQLRWTARAEGRVYGYLAYRATERSGPFVRVSPAIIHVPQDGLEEHTYEFHDEGAQACRTYYYYLDQVMKSGRKLRFSGVAAKTTECAGSSAADVGR